MPTNNSSLAVRLAEFAAAVPADDIPDVAFARAKMSLASTVASAAMGFSIPSARIIRELDLRAGGAANDLPVPFAPVTTLSGSKGRRTSRSDR